jgi:hypothetical protein
VDSNGSNGSGGAWRHRIIERMATIRLHSSIARRLVRQPGPIDRDAVADQFDHIDKNLAEATRLVDEWPLASR